MKTHDCIQRGPVHFWFPTAEYLAHLKSQFKRKTNEEMKAMGWMRKSARPKARIKLLAK